MTYKEVALEQIRKRYEQIDSLTADSVKLCERNRGMLCFMECEECRIISELRNKRDE